MDSLDHGATMNYGLCLNSDSQNNITANQDPSRVDLFVAGSGSMEWGARLGYASFTSGDDEGTAFDLTVSAVLGGADVWLGFSPSATTTIADADTEYNSDMRLGFTYGVADHTLFAEYSSEGLAGDDADAYTTITVGMGKTMAAGDNATVFYDARVISESNGSSSTGQLLLVTRISLN